MASGFSILAAVAAAFMLTTAAGAEVINYGCVLDDAQEVPPTGSPAFGGGQFQIDTDANTVSFRIAFVGLTAAETLAHIHGPADPGVNGGVLTALPLGNPKTGVWNYLEGQEGDILAGKTYVNIHSGAFPAGEIRGQIVPLNASLDQAQEVPPTGSAGLGWGVFTINTTTNMLNYYIAFGGLGSAETAAHIHGAALHGTNSGVLHALPAGSPKVGSWNYGEGVEEALLTGRTYVNIHTNGFPGGEIRGQICPVVIPIDSQQEVPPTPSNGAGVALVSIDLGTSDISFDLRNAGLTSAETAAHIHGFAPPGANAGVLMNLNLGARKLGLWNYGAGNRGDVLSGLTYFNIHTTNFPAGEIRGQIQGFNPLPAADAGDPVLPLTIRLAPNHPNPFQASTNISFNLEESEAVRVSLYDSQGRLVRTLVDGEMSAGSHSVPWDGRDNAGRETASGVYRCVLHTSAGDLANKVNLIR